jgi:hypothetical protein
MSQVAYLHIGRERLVGKPYNFTYNCQISAMPVAGLDEASAYRQRAGSSFHLVARKFF